MLVMEMAIQQVDLPVRDLGRAIEFYRDKVGLPVLFSSENMAFFDGAGVRLALVPNPDAEASQATVWFRVGDLESAVADLKMRGVAFEREPHLVAHFPAHDLWMAFFRDPDGNPLGLISERYCALGAASE